MNPQEAAYLYIALEQAGQGKREGRADPAVFGAVPELLEARHWPPQAFELYDDPRVRSGRGPYRPAKFMDALADADRFATPTLTRREVPQYRFGSTSFVTPRISVDLELPELPLAQLRAAFELTGALAGLFRPVYGSVAFEWLGGETDMGRAGLIASANATSRYGFEVVPPRCYVGAELLDNFDLPALRNLGVDVTPTDWGAVRLDALKDPWAVPFAELSAQLQRLGAYFAEQGLMGDYSQALVKKAGVNWNAARVE